MTFNLQILRSYLNSSNYFFKRLKTNDCYRFFETQNLKNNTTFSKYRSSVGTSGSYYAAALHVLELVDAALGVALADLAEGLVLVAALAHVLAVDLVHRGFLGVVAGLREVLLQRLEERNDDDERG